MKLYLYPPREDWPGLIRRPATDSAALFDKVGGILSDVRARGDKAVKEWSLKFDGQAPECLEVPRDVVRAAADELSDDLRRAIVQAKANIEKFHRAQLPHLPKVETMPGVLCWQQSLPIEKVGLYIPGGTAPLFSTVLMLAVPAKLAGCDEVVLCSPIDKTRGEIHPAVLYAAGLCGIEHIFRIGGVQAIGAMAYGTESVPKVYKIFGPGNQFVMAAKQMVSLDDTAIDMPAGPSEVEVLADATARVEFIAADLLSQAEHGADSQVVLVTDSEELARQVQAETLRQCAVLPRHGIAEKALENSRLVVLRTRDEMMAFTNAYAPEHLIISCADARQLAGQVRNAGSVFLGNYTPESAGDYASGTNHTLPTKGYARAYSGVSLDSFLKKTTFQEITREGLQQLGGIIEVMAENEALFAHRNAVTLRLKAEMQDRPEKPGETGESGRIENPGRTEKTIPTEKA